MLANKVAVGLKTMTRRQIGRAAFKVGQILYVREPWSVSVKYDKPSGSKHIPDDALINYRSDGLATYSGRKRLARFMPMRFARTWLRITAVRAERLQDITEEDAIAEGIELFLFVTIHNQRQVGVDGGKLSPKQAENSVGYHFLPLSDKEDCYDTARLAFGALWDSIYEGTGQPTWQDNPLVSVITVERIQKGGRDDR